MNRSGPLACAFLMCWKSAHTSLTSWLRLARSFTWIILSATSFMSVRSSALYTMLLAPWPSLLSTTRRSRMCMRCRRPGGCGASGVSSGRMMPCVPMASVMPSTKIVPSWLMLKLSSSGACLSCGMAQRCGESPAPKLCRSTTRSAVGDSSAGGEYSSIFRPSALLKALLLPLPLNALLCPGAEELRKLGLRVAAGRTLLLGPLASASGSRKLCLRE
mmetsp:Transcript_26969/g.37181  ORF Transcript_26969/g.37181 Transcript_26969/m.37181 type:complete len:217 (+) Transcript_26969:1633-2283(+)